MGYATLCVALVKIFLRARNGNAIVFEIKQHLRIECNIL
jgi:hypothetical protein